MNETYLKPPGLGPEYGDQFQDPTIVKAYKHREPYSDEVFKFLLDLAGTAAPYIADIGCGPGDLSLGLSKFASQVDAIDLSEEMITSGKLLAPHVRNITWIHSLAEAAPIEGPYDLITAADSVHWMDWPTLFGNMRKWLKPNNFFCVVGRSYDPKEWWTEDFQSIISMYTTNKEFRSYNIIEELKKSGFVEIVGNIETKPISFKQSVDDLIEAFHSRNGFSRKRMGASATEFDSAARRHLSNFATNDVMNLHSVSQITWMTIA